MPKTFRIGQIVPSSNTTMETEVPAIFRARETILPEGFTFHSSRMRMKHVTKDELAAMDVQSLRCAAELADARVDVMGYACLVAIMASGNGYHCESETRLGKIAADEGCNAPIVTSAGALVQGLHALRAKRISIITPYMRPLTDLVVGYLEHEGIKVVESVALEIPDNLAVGRRDPMALIAEVERLDLSSVDVVVVSACVQMPSLPAIQIIENKIGRPVTSAAACTAWRMMKSLGLKAEAPDCGAILSGNF